jgi:glycerol-3-phosphate O-acyltransferase
MFQPVTLPLWLLLLVLAFAAVTFASHFLFPSVRWFFRRRLERAVGRLNRRLKRPIQPFKLARRHDTIQRLIYDRDVLAAVAEHARREGVPEAVAHQRALRYAREIVPAFSAFTYFGLASRAARRLSQALFDVRMTGDAAALDAIDHGAEVVFVINHRSNMDYVLVTYLVSDRAALTYAVGEWARVWPLSGLIRAMGAYFIRRRYRGALYHAVLGRYVAMATAGGVTQALFPEGGLSLDGRLQPPRMGILRHVWTGHVESGREVVFVPVGIAYDRVLEDRVLVEAAATGERPGRARHPTNHGVCQRHLWRRLRGRAGRFGRAAVAFGPPLSLTAFRAARPSADVEALAEVLMARVAAAIPALPVPLVAAALMAVPLPTTRAALGGRLAPMAGDAEPGRVVEQGLALLIGRGLVVEAGGAICPAPGAEPLVAFYAASLAHRNGGDEDAQGGTAAAT